MNTSAVRLGFLVLVIDAVTQEIPGQDYDTRTQFMFTGLNDIKPAMIEEATRKARGFFAPETKPVKAPRTLWKVEAERKQQASLWGW